LAEEEAEEEAYNAIMEESECDIKEEEEEEEEEDESKTKKAPFCYKC